MKGKLNLAPKPETPQLSERDKLLRIGPNCGHIGEELVKVADYLDTVGRMLFDWQDGLRVGFVDSAVPTAVSNLVEAYAAQVKQCGEDLQDMCRIAKARGIE
jgi:hypothetical protein